MELPGLLLPGPLDRPADRQQPGLPALLRTPGERAAKIRAGGPVLDQANEALGYLEILFPDSIGEACFIDRAGPEIARMVRGVRAAQPDLSPDESAAPFFGPTFALRHGQVYQARPYGWPDTQEWVVSNSTLMPTPDGSKRAIVHSEVTIESFRRLAAGLSSQFDVAVVEAGSGRVMIDSRRPQALGARWAHPRTTASAGGRAAAAHAVRPQRFNAYNDTFGHPAGDALLVRLATALEQAMAGHGGSAHRLGGDEFCILAQVSDNRVGAITAAASQALTEHGGGFSITASYGSIVLPEESQDITEARGAGGQFDPAVVDAFSELVVELVWPTAPVSSEVSGGGAR